MGCAPRKQLRNCRNHTAKMPHPQGEEPEGDKGLCPATVYLLTARLFGSRRTANQSLTVMQKWWPG